MKRLLALFLAVLASAASASGQVKRGDQFSSRANRALELCFDSSGTFICGALAGTVTGTGTLNMIPRWSGVSTLIDGSLSDTGAIVTATAGLFNVGLPAAHRVTIGIVPEGAIVFEGATLNAFETQIVATDPTADRTIRMPDQGGTMGVFPLAATTAVANDDVAIQFGTALNASIAWDSAGGELDITSAAGGVHQTAPFSQWTFGTGAFDGWFVDDTGGSTQWEVDTTPGGNFFRLRGDFATGGPTGARNMTAFAIDPYNPPSGITTGSWTGIRITTGSGADHTGGSIRGIDIEANSPDVDTQEDAITVGTGWDRAVVFAGSAAELATTAGDLNLEPAAGSSVVVNSTRRLILGSDVFANLGAGEANGSIVYCSDCTIANPCAGAGTGAVAKRINGAWVCN